MFGLFKKPSARSLLVYAGLSLAALQLAGCSSREERAQKYYEHGLSYLEAQDFVKARVELRNAVQLNPSLIEAWRSLARVDEHDRNWQGVSGSLRKIIEIDPTDVPARLGLGRLMLLGGALDESLKMANAAADLDPKNAEVVALKAAVLFRLKDTDGTIKTAQKALEIDPANMDANVVLAVAKASQGDSDSALRILANVPADHRNDLSVLSLEINIYERSGDLPKAESLLRKLMALHPDEPVYRAQLIRFYMAHKRQDDAIKELRATVAANPNDATAEINLVNLLNVTSGPAAARTELVTRINAGGTVFPYQIALAKLDFSQGNVADSTKLLEQLIHNTSQRDDLLIAETTLADIYMTKNNVAAAEPLINDILSKDSRNIHGLVLRSTIRVDRGQTDEAITDLRSALNDQPRSPEVLTSLALAYERSGSIELADKAFSDATKASGFAPTTGLNYVAFLRRRGLTTQAENVLNDLAGRNQNNIAVLSALAQVKLARQDWAGAHEIAGAIRNLNDKGDVADQINGAAFGGQKKFSDSLAVLEKAYSANPDAVQPMASLVGAYIQAQQTDKAVAFLQSVLSANPGNAEALVLMGSIQLSKNDPNQALKMFQTAIKQQPNDAAGYRALADLYVRQRKTDEATKTIQAGLQQQPKSFPLQLTLAGLFELKGEYDSAIAEYEAMLKDQPGSMVVVNNLASLLTDHRTDKESSDRANALVVLLKNSQVPQFKDTMGWVNYQRGNYTAASSLLESAAAELPNVPLVHYHLGMIYLKTGQDAKALERFKKAQDLAPNDASLKMKIDAALKSRSDKDKG